MVINTPLSSEVSMAAFQPLNWVLMGCVLVRVKMGVNLGRS